MPWMLRWLFCLFSLVIQIEMTFFHRRLRGDFLICKSSTFILSTVQLLTNLSRNDFQAWVYFRIQNPTQELRVLNSTETSFFSVLPAALKNMKLRSLMFQSLFISMFCPLVLMKLSTLLKTLQMFWDSTHLLQVFVFSQREHNSMAWLFRWWSRWPQELWACYTFPWQVVLFPDMSFKWEKRLTDGFVFRRPGVLQVHIIRWLKISWNFSLFFKLVFFLLTFWIWKLCDRRWQRRLGRKLSAIRAYTIVLKTQRTLHNFTTIYHQEFLSRWQILFGI